MNDVVAEPRDGCWAIPWRIRSNAPQAIEGSRNRRGNADIAQEIPDMVTDRRLEVLRLELLGRLYEVCIGERFEPDLGQDDVALERSHDRSVGVVADGEL